VQPNFILWLVSKRDTVKPWHYPRHPVTPRCVCGTDITSGVVFLLFVIKLLMLLLLLIECIVVVLWRHCYRLSIRHMAINDIVCYQVVVLGIKIWGSLTSKHFGGKGTFSMCFFWSYREFWDNFLKKIIKWGPLRLGLFYQFIILNYYLFWGLTVHWENFSLPSPPPHQRTATEVLQRKWHNDYETMCIPWSENAIECAYHGVCMPWSVHTMKCAHHGVSMPWSVHVQGPGVVEIWLLLTVRPLISHVDAMTVCN